MHVNRITLVPALLSAALLFAHCATPQAAGPDAVAEVPPLGFTPRGTVHPVPVGDAPCRGPADARVTIVEFTDFECSHCARAQETLRTLEERHPGLLRVCFRHRTIPLHFSSRDAAEAAEAARVQGRFWQLHDLLFAHQRALDHGSLQAYARRAGLDVARFDADRLSEPIMERVDQDEALAAELEVRAAPTFFINGRRLTGARPLPDFDALVQIGLDEASRALAAGVPADRLYETLVLDVVRDSEAPKQLSRPIPIQAGDPCRGPADAPVTLVEFTDFECPFCGMAKQTVDALEKQFVGKLRVCVKMHPLSYHPHARRAALWALAAARQDAFFQIYDDLFANAEALDNISMAMRARELGLDVDRLERDADSDEVKRQLERHLAEARSAGLRGTPSFTINDEIIFGAQPDQVFAQAIRRQLQQAP